ncbi:MAG: class F sortase [Candidatus Gracilibacteria bacterium]|nr:class F sortase [Candidatus Gracilibacteria bacterium]
MQSKISLKGLLLTGGILFFPVIIFSLTFNLYSQVSYTEPVALTSGKSVKSLQNITPKKQTKPSLPVRLKIPNLKIDIPLEHVGITRQGAMDVPKSPTGAAWFNLGPRPGEEGSAVIAGHYGVWKNGKVGAFNNLSQLNKGDKLFIEDEKGKTITFVVREFRTYGQNEDASSVFGSSDGKAHLNLITCQGAWNKIKKSYPNRLIVFTDREMK